MTLLDAVRIARRFWMTIAACILLAVGVAAAYAASQPRLYTATSEAYVSVRRAPGARASPRCRSAATWRPTRPPPTPP